MWAKGCYRQTSTGPLPLPSLLIDVEGCVCDGEERDKGVCGFSKYLAVEVEEEPRRWGGGGWGEELS